VAPLRNQPSGTGSRLFLLTGEKVRSFAGGAAQDVTAVADVKYDLPANWAGAAYGSGAIRDLNGDGFGDIAVGEFSDSVVPITGRVLVLW